MSENVANKKKEEPVHWYPVYTMPRWEKKLSVTLQSAGYTCYCPVQKQRRKWKQRYKIVEEPVFRGYVFVRIPAVKRCKILDFPGVVNFVYFEKKPGTIREEEIEMIKRFLGECDQLQAGPVEVIQGDKIEVISGVFAGCIGEAETIKGGYITVHIESMGMQLRATVHKTNVRSAAQSVRRAPTTVRGSTSNE